MTNKYIKTYSLLKGTTISTTEKDYSTYDERKFSDYDIVIFTAGISVTDLRLQFIVPYTLYIENESTQYVVQTMSNGVLQQVVFKYASDTSINIRISSGTILTHAQVWGIKLSE